MSENSGARGWPKGPEIECCDKPLEFIAQEGAFWRAYIPELADCGTCQTSYQRKPGSNIAYKKTENGLECTSCGEMTETIKVTHPIWDSPFPMSAFSGKNYYEDVPYCPHEEQEPNSSGAPIRVDPSVVNPIAEIEKAR